MPEMLGRTNKEFPEVWLSLIWNGKEPGESLVDRALESGSPIEVSASPALWGGHGAGKATIVLATGGLELANNTEPSRAPDLIGARLIEVLSGLGRPCLDIFVFQYRTALEESVLDGVFTALESARSEGLVQFVALEPVGPVLASRAMWQFRDAFELLVLPDSPAYESLIPLAEQRRVGVVKRGSAGNPRLMRVSTSSEIQDALGVFR
ncbi:MAG: hypothetical protein KF812_01260 [Fimbriimonadaceae bacterium]|nr:hypothetical protein [Fimbriimonadaceae bacterium]